MESLEGINEDDLDWDGDLLTLNGIPYSGPAYTCYSNGNIETKSTYQCGFKEGICREWFPDGTLKVEWTAERGRAEGVFKEWHPNGRIKSLSVHELGVQLSTVEWDRSGNKIPGDATPSAAQLKLLQIMRERKRQGKS